MTLLQDSKVRCAGIVRLNCVANNIREARARHGIGKHAQPDTREKAKTL